MGAGVGEAPNGSSEACSERDIISTLCWTQHPTPPHFSSPPNLNSTTCRLQNFKDSEDVLADYPLPFDAIEQPEAPAAGGRKAAAKTPGRGRAAAAADDSSEEEEDGGLQMPPSSDDEQDGEVGGSSDGGLGGAEATLGMS